MDEVAGMCVALSPSPLQLDSHDGRVYMPRNNLKSFPTASRLRGLAHFCAACHVPVQPPIEPPDLEPAWRTDVDPAPGPISSGPAAVPEGSVPVAMPAGKPPELLPETIAASGT